MKVAEKSKTGEGQHSQHSQHSQHQELLRKLFSVSTLHPLGLSLLLHFAQNWCGVNVIVFKEIFSSCQLYYSILLTSIFILIFQHLTKLDIDLNLPPSLAARP